MFIGYHDFKTQLESFLTNAVNEKTLVTVDHVNSFFDQIKRRRMNGEDAEE